MCVLFLCLSVSVFLRARAASLPRSSYLFLRSQTSIVRICFVRRGIYSSLPFHCIPPFIMCHILFHCYAGVDEIYTNRLLGPRHTDTAAAWQDWEHVMID